MTEKQADKIRGTFFEGCNTPHDETCIEKYDTADFGKYLKLLDEALQKQTPEKLLGVPTARIRQEGEQMTYPDIVPEINAVCEKNPKCFVDIVHGTDNGCPYFDICQKEFESGGVIFETDFLARFMELKTGKPHSKFYFTFGSDPGFPYQNTYIIVLAESEKAAVEKFRDKYPDRHKDIVNCAFWYSEERWNGSQNETGYGDPAEVIA